MKLKVKEQCKSKEEVPVELSLCQLSNGDVVLQAHRNSRYISNILTIRSDGTVSRKVSVNSSLGFKLNHLGQIQFS